MISAQKSLLNIEYTQSGFDGSAINRVIRKVTEPLMYSIMVHVYKVKHVTSLPHAASSSAYLKFLDDHKSYSDWEVLVTATMRNERRQRF
jgi:hypothetical protein